MDIRKIMYALGVFCILGLLQSCPPHSLSSCNNRIGADIPDLTYLTPLQAVYQQGDEVVLKLFINANEPYFEGNIYERTGDETAVLKLGSSVLFTDNELSFIKGSQGTRPHFFNMPYNSVTGDYELEMKIKLNRTGTYTQEAATYIYIYIPGNGICNKFILDTNIVGMNQYGNIEFEVLP